MSQISSGGALPAAAGTMFIYPHAHMTSRTTDDYEAMATPAWSRWSSRRSGSASRAPVVGSFVDYFDSLLGWERFRAAQFGIRHHCTIGLNPKEANDEALADRCSTCCRISSQEDKHIDDLLQSG